MLHRLSSIPSLRRLLRAIPPHQFLRYGLVGGFNTVFGLVAFTVFVKLLRDRFRFGFIVGSLLSSIVSITVAFFLYKWFVFRTKGNTFQEWLKCLAVYSSGIALGTAVLPVNTWFVMHVLHVSDRKAPYVAGYIWTVLSIVYNFIGHKKFSFKEKKAIESDPLTPTGL